MKLIQTSLDDLPIEILVDIYKYFNLPETLKLRLNKRLDQVQLSTRHSIKSMQIQVCTNNYALLN